jgi:hypothetical protein
VHEVINPSEWSDSLQLLLEEARLSEVIGVPNALLHDATISNCHTSWIAQALITFCTFKLMLLLLLQHVQNKCILAALFLMVKQLDATEVREILYISFFFFLLL